jgi:hypothetical protein
MTQRTKICLISCSALKEELKMLVNRGDLDVDLVFVSKYFHVDFGLIEKNLRRTIEKTLPRYPAGTVLVYGDLCLGLNEEMKSLAEEYGLVKVDALNCTDCVLGGKGKSADADPNHELLILNPGLTDFFENVRAKAQQEGLDENAFKGLFSGLKGIVLLDTLGRLDKDKAALEKIDTGLVTLDIRTIGLGKLKDVITEAIEKNRKKQHKHS